jgi:hypothetical protein
MRRKLSSIVTLMVLGFATTASAQRWELFGEASSVKDNSTPGTNPWVVELVSDDDPGFGGIDYDLKNDIQTFDDLDVLSTLFNPTDDDCRGGSPRFQISVDTDGDGDHDGNIFVYLGPAPAFTGCPPGWNNSGNLIGNEDPGRYDTSQLVPGTQVNTYSGTAAIMDTFPDHEILGISLVVDAGWSQSDGEQTFRFDNVAVNEDVMNGRNVKNK